MQALPPIVGACWLRDHHHGLVVADVRWRLMGPSGREEYEREHIAGAVFVDLDVDLADIGDPRDGRHPLPDPVAFAVAMGALGIGDDDPVVAYDDAGGLFAARLVWMLRAIGHPAALLDGGLPMWDGPLEAGPGHPRPPAAFTARPWPGGHVAAIDDVTGPGVVLLDARARARYRGDIEPVDPRPGHIPGAINVPCEEHLGDDGVLLPTQALRHQFAAVGVTDATGVVVSCGSGVNACHTLLVMEHAGMGQGRLFPGSYSAWSNRPELPVATGS